MLRLSLKLKVLASYGLAALLLPSSHAWVVAPFGGADGGRCGLGGAITRRLPTTAAVNGAGAGGRRRRGCVFTALPLLRHSR